MDHELKQELEIRNLKTDKHVLMYALDRIRAEASEGLRMPNGHPCHDLFVAIEAHARVALESDGDLSQSSGPHNKG